MKLIHITQSTLRFILTGIAGPQIYQKMCNFANYEISLTEKQILTYFFQKQAWHPTSNFDKVVIVMGVFLKDF